MYFLKLSIVVKKRIDQRVNLSAREKLSSRQFGYFMHVSSLSSIPELLHVIWIYTENGGVVYPKSYENSP